MKAIFKSASAQKIRRGQFNIDIYLPGLAVNDTEDENGFYQLGRFDMAHLLPGVFVGMHPHRDDEILTYMREGIMVHEDTKGGKEEISSTHLMLMNSGKGIYHQESIPNSGVDVRLLQIFIRPGKAGLDPNVQFSALEDPYSLNSWRVLAGMEDKIPRPPLILRSDVVIYDCRLDNFQLTIPAKPEKSFVLFVFSGEVQIGRDQLSKGDGMVFSQESISVKSISTSDLILFELDENAAFTRSGMYSGVS